MTDDSPAPAGPIRSESDPRVDEWVRAYNSGLTIDEIAYRDGRSKNQVHAWIRRHPDYRPRRRGWRRRQTADEFWEPDEIGELLDRYEDGGTPDGIAASYHVRCFGSPSADDVRRVLRRAGVSLRSGAEVRETLGAYADKVGAYETDLAGYLARRGLAPRQQRIVAGHNVDITVDPVAIEVQSGAGIDRERARRILADGWVVLYVHHSPGRGLTETGRAIIGEFVDAARRHPATAAGLHTVSADGADNPRRIEP